MDRRTTSRDLFFSFIALTHKFFDNLMKINSLTKLSKCVPIYNYLVYNRSMFSKFALI